MHLQRSNRHEQLLIMKSSIRRWRKYIRRVDTNYLDMPIRDSVLCLPIRMLKSINDFKGQKIRTMENSYHLKFWKTLGANPTPMTFSRSLYRTSARERSMHRRILTKLSFPANYMNSRIMLWRDKPFATLYFADRQ